MHSFSEQAVATCHSTALRYSVSHGLSTVVCCRLLPPAAARKQTRILASIDFTDEHKLADFIKSSENLVDEMRLREKLATYRVYSYIGQQLEFIKRLSFALALLMNLIMLMSLAKGEDQGASAATGHEVRVEVFGQWRHFTYDGTLFESIKKATGGGHDYGSDQARAGVGETGSGVGYVMYLLGTMQLVLSIVVFAFKVVNLAPLVYKEQRKKAHRARAQKRADKHAHSSVTGFEDLWRHFRGLKRAVLVLCMFSLVYWLRHGTFLPGRALPFVVIYLTVRFCQVLIPTIS